LVGGAAEWLVVEVWRAGVERAGVAVMAWQAGQGQPVASVAYESPYGSGYSVLAVDAVAGAGGDGEAGQRVGEPVIGDGCFGQVAVEVAFARTAGE
jgi:hypothetical protein